MRHPNRRNAYQRKKAACGLCKPHKRGWAHRFRARDRAPERTR